MGFAEYNIARIDSEMRAAASARGYTLDENGFIVDDAELMRKAEYEAEMARKRAAAEREARQPGGFQQLANRVADAIMRGSVDPAPSFDSMYETVWQLHRFVTKDGIAAMQMEEIQDPEFLTDIFRAAVSRVQTKTSERK